MAGLLSITRKVLLIQVVCLIQSLTAEELTCDPKSVPFNDFNIDQFLGVWYELYHHPATHQELYSCFIDDYKKSPEGDITISTSLYDKTEKKRETSAGTVHVYNNVLNAAYEDRQEWSAEYYVAATDYTGYSIIVGCPEITAKEPNTYVMFRSTNPAESVKKAAEEALKSFNFNLSDFYKEC